MDLISGISAASEALKLIKDLRGIDRQLDVAELKLRLADLVDNLLEAKEALQDAKQERSELIDQIDALNAAMHQHAKMVDENGLLFELDKNGNRAGEPFCNQCFVRENKLYRLIQSKWNQGPRYDCKNCNTMLLPESRR